MLGLILKADDGGRVLDALISGANPPAMVGRCGPSRGGPLSIGYGAAVDGRS